MTEEHPAEEVRIAFVCVRNAGRSQMSAVFAERERRRLGDGVTILTGGTHPADDVHEVVVETMAEEGFDLGGRTPREISTEELESCDYVATMGCSTLELDTSGGVDVRDWDLDDPHGRDPEAVRAIREEIERTVVALFEEFDSDAE
jgi:protein-tyrosine-phosphatase